MVLLWMGVLAAEPVAVVELFTSEGCSSCPSADALLREIAVQAKKEDRPIYVLSFHVDYWDRLGWADPFGDPRWTGRQRSYAKQFAEKSVYTPQVVVNGTERGVGSDRALVKGLIAGALSKRATSEIAGTATAGDGAVLVDLVVTAAEGRVFIAVVEPERRSEVTRGENKGRTLVHVNVVRGMVEGSLDGTQGPIPVADGVDLANVSVFAWVQDPVTNAVTGASKFRVSARAAE